ncbi:TetR-like C-terminal domain-containing protein [Nocardia sp. NPDC051321]|uniref:TetR-like C-terminal domain-containing protein n=1 Tax=Nocardia sp. NPDC051321 TaxID=3364323 RepID=UPI0037ACBF2C
MTISAPSCSASTSRARRVPGGAVTTSSYRRSCTQGTVGAAAASSQQRGQHRSGLRLSANRRLTTVSSASGIPHKLVGPDPRACSPPEPRFSAAANLAGSRAAANDHPALSSDIVPRHRPHAVQLAFSGLLAATGLSPAQIREGAMGDQAPPQNRTIYRQGAACGELDLERVPPAVLAVPFDLVRHDLLMDLEPLDTDRIRSIVDQTLLPLVRAHRAT